MTYPDGYVLDYDYGTGSGLNDRISRLESLTDTTGVLEGYDYLGLSTVVRRAHPQLGVDLTYVKLSTEANGDAGDEYNGLDRFGRVADQRWLETTGNTDVDRYGYGYNSNGNRLYRENLVDAAFSELYHAGGSTGGYDKLGQMTDFARGVLGSGKDSVSSVSRSQAWDYDAVGNWESVSNDGGSNAVDDGEFGLASGIWANSNITICR